MQIKVPSSRGQGNTPPDHLCLPLLFRRTLLTAVNLVCFRWQISCREGTPSSQQDASHITDTPSIRELMAQNEGGGFVRYAGIAASAPSMGLVAAAYRWSEVFYTLDPQRIPHRETARLWSPFCYCGEERCNCCQVKSEHLLNT